jgi:glycine dehydrogenase subunit 2
LPELSEHEVLQHYLRLSQQTLGMMGISLFGTCTMKYNPRVSDRLVNEPALRDLHPRQDPSTMQGALRVIHELSTMMQELSGMDVFVFEPGGGADAAYLHTCVTRAYHAARGELGQRDEIITTAQAHPCNAATAAASGFKVITIGLEHNGLPSLEALRAVVSDRTAALMINNPDDMGLYNPQLPTWVRTVHEAGGLAFYDHANFNGVMTRLRARELGFDACMFMLHKTFGGAKGGGGPAVGAYGCTEELAAHLGSPWVVADDGQYSLVSGDGTAGRVREFLGNLPVIVRAYAWLLAHGAEGLRQAADLSVLANNYMEKRLLAIRGVEKAFPSAPGHRLEMTRYSLAQVTADTGVTAVDIQHRMTDFGIDAFWLSHEPWIIPEPFTPEAGETWSKEDLDRWIDVLALVVDEAYREPDIVRSAPHNQPISRVDVSTVESPDTWATTWRALKRKWPHGIGGTAS